MRLLALFLCISFSQTNLYASEVVQNINGEISISIDGQFPVSGEVDILAVIDDSGSMHSHQRSLQQHISYFANSLINSGVEFHFGVITSDFEKYQGNLFGSPRFLTPNTPNLIYEFKNKFAVGTNGIATETFFSPLVEALSPPMRSGYNSGFYRSDAKLSVIFITDSFDQSSLSAWDVADNLMRLKNGVMSKISLDALLFDGNDTSCSLFEQPPVKITELLRLLNGQAHDICKITTDTIDEVVQNIIRGTTTSDYKPGVELVDINLHAKPDLKTLKVMFGTQEIKAQAMLQPGWTYDPVANQLDISPLVEWQRQGPGTKIVISFKPLD